MSSDCLFCKIVSGDVKADVVHETDTTVAFRDIEPQAPTHVLVIPRRHEPDAASLAKAAPTELVYDVHLDESTKDVVLDMTLTSAACPLTDVIMDQTEQALEGLVNDVTINWVWMPPWGPDKITDDGREMLRALGFNV